MGESVLYEPLGAGGVTATARSVGEHDHMRLTWRLAAQRTGGRRQ